MSRTQVMDAIGDFVLNHGKLWALVSSSIICFFIAAVMFILISTPFMLYGTFTFYEIIPHAIAVGIGSAVFPAIMSTMAA